MNISIANGIRFASVGGSFKNFQNTLSSNDKFGRMLAYSFSHKFLNTDQSPLQLISDSTSSNPGISLFYNYDEGGKVAIIAYQNTVIGNLTYYDFIINQQKSGYLTATIDGIDWISEHIEIVEKTPEILIQWFNFDNAFDYNYTTNIVNFMRIDGMINNYKPKGKSTIFDNQGEIVKIKERLFRQYDLITEVIPQQIAEILTVAMAHDVVVINDREIISEQLPKIKQLGNTNLYEFSVTVTERAGIGINRHDSGTSEVVTRYYIDKNGNYYTDAVGNLYTD